MFTTRLIFAFIASIFQPYLMIFQTNHRVKSFTMNKLLCLVFIPHLKKAEHLLKACVRYFLKIHYTSDLIT